MKRETHEYFGWLIIALSLVVVVLAYSLGWRYATMRDIAPLEKRISEIEKQLRDRP